MTRTIADQSEGFRQFELADWSIPVKATRKYLLSNNFVSNMKKRAIKVNKDDLAKGKQGRPY